MSSPRESDIAPPGYSSDGDLVSLTPTTSHSQSETGSELVSAQSHGSAISFDHAAPRRSDAQAPPMSLPTQLPRRRISSLPHHNHNSVNFPFHLTVPPVVNPVHEASASLSTVRDPLHSQSVVRLNPTNHVSLTRKSTVNKSFFSIHRASTSIQGPFTINPYLHIPAALLSPRSSRGGDQRRKNLSLAVENGGIDVDIFLVGDPPSNAVSKPLQTTMDLRLLAGAKNTHPLVARIVSNFCLRMGFTSNFSIYLLQHTPNLVRPSFHLEAFGLDGYLSLHLPTSFQGLVTVEVKSGDLNAHISLSREFKDVSMILSETSTKRGFFLGELGGWSPGEQGWEGDQVDISVQAGRVRLQLLGEKDWDGLRKMTWKIKL